MRRHSPLILFLLAFSMNASADMLVCERYVLPMTHKIGAPKRAVAQLWAKLRMPKSVKNFDMELYLSKKARFKERLKAENFDSFVFDSKSTVKGLKEVAKLLDSAELVASKSEADKKPDADAVAKKKKEYLELLQNDSFNGIVNELKHVKDIPVDNLMALREALAERHATLLDVSRIETRLAFIEAVVETYPLEFRTSGELLIGSDNVGKNKLAKLLRGVDFTKTLTRKQIEKAMASFYQILNGDPFLQARPADAILARLFQEKISSDGLFQTLDAIGLAKKGTILEKLKSPFTHRYFKLGLNTAFNLVSVGLWVKFRGVILPGAPEQKWVEWKKMPEKLLDDVARDGMTYENWVEIRKIYGPTANFDVSYQAFKRTYGIVAAVISLYFLYDIFETILEMRQEAKRKQLEAEKAVDEQINALEQQTEDIRNEIKQHKDVREELFDEWKAQYKAEHGGEPDPKSKEYRQTHDLLFGKQ